MDDHHEWGVQSARGFRTRAGHRYLQAEPMTGSSARAAGYYSMTLAPPAQVEGLDVVLRAVDDRSKRNQSVRGLRPLVLTCEQRHVIGRVYMVPDGVGPVLVAKAPDWHDSGEVEIAQGWTSFTDSETGQEIEYEVDERVQKRQIVHRFDIFAAVLDEQGPHDRWVAIECRCRSMDVTVSQIRAWLASGEARVRIGIVILAPEDDTPPG